MNYADREPRVLRFARATAVLLLITLASHAAGAKLSPNGRGQVLLFPFVTAENGWDTFIGLNLDVTGGHIVRLRFMHPKDGTALHTFNIYSRYGENWRAAVTAVQDGWALRIAEGSCTVSETGEFGGPGKDFPLDTGVSMLEVYSVSRVLDDYTAEPRDPPPQFTCEQLAQRFEPGGRWRDNPDELLTVPHGPPPEISGYFDLVKVRQGLSATLRAVAIADFAESIPHTSPAADTPGLADADPVAVLDDGTVFEPPSGEGIDAIAMLLSRPDLPGNSGSRHDIVNDVITVAGIAASTDWIVAFPLRGYAPERAPNAEVGGEPRLCETTGNFNSGEDFVQTSTCGYSWLLWGGGQYKAYGRFCPSPSPPVYHEPMACNAVNSIAFGDSAPIFLDAASDYQYAMPGIGDFSAADTSARFAYALLGGWNRDGQGYKPVLGFRVTTFINGTLGSGSKPTLANYMTIRPHVAR